MYCLNIFLVGDSSRSFFDVIFLASFWFYDPVFILFFLFFVSDLR